MRNLIMFGAVVLLSGCITMPEKIPSMAPGEIKKVAVVGYTVDVKDNDGKKFKNAFKFKTESGKINESPMSAKVYGGLISNLKKSTKWRVVSTSKLVKVPKVKVLYKKKNARMQTGEAIVPANYVRYQKTGVPQAHYVTNRKFDKAEFAKSLGVDAIVLYRVTVNNSKSMRIGGFGVGSAKYSASINMEVYDSNGILVFDINTTSKNKVPKVDKSKLTKFGNDKNALYSYDAVRRALPDQIDQIKAQF